MAGLSLRHMAGLIATPVVLIACAVFATATIERQSALHAAREQEQAQRLLTGMLDQETGARGYFETGRRPFLSPWYRGQAEFAQAFASERALAGADAPLEQSLREQALRSAQWQADVRSQIERLQRTGRRPSLPAVEFDKSLMDGFRQLNALFATQLFMRRDRALSLATWLAVTVAVGLSMLLVLAGLVFLRRSNRREMTRLHGQQELRELLQVSVSEEESQLLLIRHVQRRVPGSTAAVLNRNSSDDRLEIRREEHPNGSLLQGLDTESLKPRSCLAIRLSHSYRQRPGQEPLLRCEACGKVAGQVVCEPLLVGGQVIGSVLAAREQPMSEKEVSVMQDSVLLAAPILANQRNLAVAERRAASDALTGLPNRRAADETLLRMVAHAGRTVTPLSAVILDLDHFKQVNDLHGHDRGDEALAAIGQILGTGLRASDFAARYGGEEFLLLLPDTDRAAAVQVAEKLRRVIEQTELREIGRLTGSFGVAALPEDAVDPEQLLRKADRALYAAKARGRNRIEVAAPAGGSDSPRHLAEI